MAASSTVTEMVELLITVDRWANEALLKPELCGLGDTRFKRALDELSDGLRGAFDEMSAGGAVGELEGAKQEISQVQNPEMRRGLMREIDGYVQLATGPGADFDRAKGWALDEGLSPWEVLKEYRELQQQVEA